MSTLSECSCSSSGFSFFSVLRLGVDLLQMFIEKGNGLFPCVVRLFLAEAVRIVEILEAVARTVVTVKVVRHARTFQCRLVVADIVG